MKLWILLTLTFLIQEPITSSGILFEAYQHHYNIWLIHLLFSVATLFDIIVGYYVGIYIALNGLSPIFQIISFPLGIFAILRR